MISNQLACTYRYLEYLVSTRLTHLLACRSSVLLTLRGRILAQELALSTSPRESVAVFHRGVTRKPSVERLSPKMFETSIQSETGVLLR